jgi:hypothetical protein
METAEERLAAHDVPFVQMNERLGSIEARIIGLENRLLGVGAFLGALIARMELHECVAFTQMNERMTTLQWMVGLSMAWTTMLTGAAVGLIVTYG